MSTEEPKAVRTELRWSYRPADFFEAPYTFNAGDYELSIQDGSVVIVLTVPQDPLSPVVRDRIQGHLSGIFMVRQLQEHREFDLNGPIVHNEYDNSSRSVDIQGSAAIAFGTVMAPDVISKDASGRIISDTRAERIAGHKAMMDAVAPKVSRSTPLSSMLRSYSRSVSDSDNELIYLYEVRDVLAKHYGGGPNARAALRITEAEWRLIGHLADAEPVAEGRHRGKHHDALRPATPQELELARATIRNWIVAFAAAV